MYVQIGQFRIGVESYICASYLAYNKYQNIIYNKILENP